MKDLLQLFLGFASVIDPLITLITIVSTILGVIIVGTALLQAYSLADDSRWHGHHQPTVGGIVWGLFIGGILVSPILVVQMFGNTMFDGDVNGGAFLYQNAGLTSSQQAAVKAIMAVFAVAGYISFIKGWLILNKHANGIIRDGVGMGVTHILAGTILVYLDIFLEALKNTLGIDVTFMLVN